MNIETQKHIFIGIIIVIIIILFVKKTHYAKLNKTLKRGIIGIKEQRTVTSIPINTNTIKLDDKRYNEDEKFIRDVVMGKRLEQEVKETPDTREEIEKYLTSQIDFNNMLNMDSNNNCDLIGRLAEDRLQNAELSHYKGKTIGEVYDEMTRGVYDKLKECKNPNCIIPSNNDNLTQSQYYLNNNGSGDFFFSKNQIKYETDGVDNGGQWFGNVKGYDGSYEADYLAIKN